MSKQIKDFIHYYIGQPCVYDDPYVNAFKLEGVVTSRIIMEFRNPQLTGAVINVRPYLRTLSSLTEEEATELCRLITEPKRQNEVEVFFIEKEKIHYSDGSRWSGDGVDELNDLYVYYKWLSPEQFHYLLSKGFDLFGLIEAGQALDSAQIKQP